MAKYEIDYAHLDEIVINGIKIARENGGVTIIDHSEYGVFIPRGSVGVVIALIKAMAAERPAKE